jgi:hypothetical protein
MITGAGAVIRQRLSQRSERPFLVGLFALSVLSAYARVAGLSHGAFFRDDAWVALTRRVPLHVAWHMVGTAPGFVLFERMWVAIAAPSTWWAQMPTFVIAVITVPLVALGARWLGLSSPASILAATLIAVSRIDVQYATHIKPYASDVLFALAVVLTGELFRRGRSLWPFAITALVAIAVSFTVAPLVLGVGVVLMVDAKRQDRLRSLVAPLLVLAVPLLILYNAVRSGISPRLRQSWAPNFFNFSSLHSLGRSLWNIATGLVAGFSDTTPHWHIAGLSKLILAFVLVATICGAVRARARLSAPWSAGLAVAVLFAAAHVAPLGTGRTDAYLYPVLALLVAYGSEGAITWLATKRQVLSRVAVGALVGLALFTVADRVVHRTPYTGGSFRAVAVAAKDELSMAHGSVLIEGTARWPWTYYNSPRVRLTFSPLYNTGFAPLSTQRHVVVMPGTIIEGGYNAEAAVRKLRTATSTLYVRTDDWPSLGDPLAHAFANHCWHVTKQQHPHGYLLEWLQRACTP